MNEPWTSISTRAASLKGEPYRSVIGTDRLGFRSELGPAVPMIDDARCQPQGPLTPRSVVLVEDSDDDAMLFARAIRKSGKIICAQRAANAREARQLLAGQRPSLVALDCHLPGESGLDLLREIRSMESFSRVPVVMMSGTESDDDVRQAYANGANSFLRKPVCSKEYVDSVSLLLEYWLEQNCVALGLINAPTSLGPLNFASAL